MSLAGVCAALFVIANWFTDWFPWRWLQNRWTVKIVLVLLGLLSALSGIPALFYSGIAVCAYVLAHYVFEPKFIKRLPLSAVAFAFGLTFVGLVGMALQDKFRFPIEALWLQLAYLLLFAPAVAVMVQALTVYRPKGFKLGVRLPVLLTLLFFAGLITYSSGSTFFAKGGISIYDGQGWTTLDSESILFDVQTSYGFYEDSHGGLWLSSGTGMLLNQSSDEGWQAYIPSSIFRSSEQSSSLTQQFKGPPLLVEDENGQFWVSYGTDLVRFDPAAGYIQLGRKKTREEIDNLSPQNVSLGGSIIREWDSDGNLLRTFVDTATDGSVTWAVFNSTGNRIVTSARWGYIARVWDANGNVLLSFAGTSVSLSPDGTRIAVTRQDGEIYFWDIEGNLLWTFQDPSAETDSVMFSPDGQKMLYIAGVLVKGIATSDGESLGSFSHGDQVLSMALSPNSRWLLTQGEEEIRVWDIATGDQVSVLDKDEDLYGLDAIRAGYTTYYPMAFSADGKWILVQWDRVVQVWETNTGREVSLLDHGEPLTYAAFSSDGRKILTEGDTTARIWDTAAAEQMSFLNKPAPDQRGIFLEDTPYAFASLARPENPVVFSSDGKWALSKRASTVHVWEVATGKVISELKHKDDVEFATFISGGQKVLTQDKQSIRIWNAATGEIIAVLAESADQVCRFIVDLSNNRIVTIVPVDEANYVTPDLGSPAQDIALDSGGNLWLVAADGRVMRVAGGYPPGDTRWEFLTSENSGLSPEGASSVHVDRSGNIWLGTADGLLRFKDGDRQEVDVPDWETDSLVHALLTDSQDRLWVGTPHGGSRWDGETWTSFKDEPGWSGRSEVVLFFEDSQQGIWAGTHSGALRYDGQKWMYLVPDMQVTAFTEGPPGVVWVGGQSGLIRYDLETEKQILFNADNSAMITDQVRDLYIDSDGKLWVSTFRVDSIARSPWWSIGLGALFFGYLFVNTYRGYRQAPETRARQLGQAIIDDPDSLYPAVYSVLVDALDAPGMLVQLASHLSHKGELAAADAVSALSALVSGQELDEALKQSSAAFHVDSVRAWAGPLHGLHSLLSSSLAARRVSEIADLELTINPTREMESISIHSRSGSVEVLPPFLSTSSADAWRELEQVTLALRKYQSVDSSADRLSYLAEALKAAESAQNAIQSVGPPEGAVMVAIVGRWRAAIGDEIDQVSGRAELKLELLTRQVRREVQVTVALRLQNTGRSVAENVIVTLQPSEHYLPANGPQVALERLSSGQSTSIEFLITPGKVETVRLACQVTWRDRMSTGNTAEFADLVRFYEIAAEFRRIPNPYIVGLPVKTSGMFHGRDDVFQFIQDNLSGAVQDRTLVLYGQRRTGKTSILYQLLEGRLGTSFIPLLIDMQELAILIDSTGSFLSELSYQLVRTLRKAGIDIEEPAIDAFSTLPTRTFNRFLDALEDKLGERRVVIMFDEFELIETKIQEGKLDPNILHYFRSLIQHRDRLLFIFTGTHQLEEMTHDYWSIFFNIALYRRVSFLSPTAAAQLIRNPVSGTLDVDELAVEKIINLTNGHPYFIQLLCWALVNHCNVQQRNYATINDVNKVIQEILTSSGAHFAYIWQQATDIERLAMVGLAHTLQPGVRWARLQEILDTLQSGGDTQMQRKTLSDVLDRLVVQEVLETPGEGELRYRFKIEMIRLWVEATKSVAIVVERGQ